MNTCAALKGVKDILGSPFWLRCGKCNQWRFGWSHNRIKTIRCCGWITHT